MWCVPEDTTDTSVLCDSPGELSDVPCVTICCTVVSLVTAVEADDNTSVPVVCLIVVGFPTVESSVEGCEEVSNTVVLSCTVVGS